ncbi:hypothetical protein YTPLAS18_13440 [Nitrospira sp.]|nr:hypothetical protein YTPLAS18_13440 [Nitrospira sp.]
MLRELILCPVFVLISSVYADADEATRLMKFFSYFEGTWRVTDFDGHRRGSLTIQRGESGTSHVLEYWLGEVKRTELWGYDPTSKSWTAIGFAHNRERYSQVMTEVPNRDTPQAGDRWSDKHEGVLPPVKRPLPGWIS